MLFWDTLYYLFAVKLASGQANSSPKNHLEIETYFSINHQAFRDLAGITTRSFVNLRKLAGKQSDPRYNVRIEKDAAGWEYLWILTNYEQLVSKNAVQKPTGLFKNGWVHRLKTYPNTDKPTRLPLAILNRFFNKPSGAIITRSELPRFAKNANAKKLPDTAAINKALAYLIDLGLVKPIHTDEFQLVPARFDQPAPSSGTFLPKSEPLSLNSPIVQQRIKEDPERAKNALTLAKAGNFENHFDEIFRDLRYVSTAEGMELLKNKVRLHRSRPQSPSRWEKCWKRFNEDQRTKSYPVQSEKVHINLADTPKATKMLNLPQIPASQIIWAKIVLWLNTPDYPQYRLPGAIHVSLRMGDRVLWERTIEDADNHKYRSDLTRAFQAVASHICDLNLTVETVLPRVSVDARLEARVWKYGGHSK